MPFFDAHLDLAYLAECGRDMTSPDLDACGGPHPPAAVTLPSLRAGGVTACLGTIFTQAVPDPAARDAATGAYTYPLGDAEAAHAAGLRQLDRYHQWKQEGLISLMPLRPPHPARARAPQPSSDTQPTPLRVGILMECADPIRTPDELPFWVERGVVAIGMAWTHGGRYAAGNGADPDDPGAALTDLGRALVRAMDALGVVHDISHLSQRATDELLSLTDATIVASHSNCRALFERDPYPNARQRHLADATIREVARRGGVIGINLLSDFLSPTITRGESVTLDWVWRHVTHVAELAGSTKVIGLGSDMDGGFPADRLPRGIRVPADLQNLLAVFQAHGVSPGDARGIAFENWARFWGLTFE